jgi:hypothetical protein
MEPASVQSLGRLLGAGVRGCRSNRTVGCSWGSVRWLKRRVMSCIKRQHSPHQCPASPLAVEEMIGSKAVGWAVLADRHELFDRRASLVLKT